MTVATTRIARSPRALRAALEPDEAAQFELEFREAAVAAGEQVDLAPIEAVLDRWWGVAALRANPLSEQERALVFAAREGDDSGWVDPGRDGSGPGA